MNNTALGAENKKEQTINFISEAHEKFYYEKLKEVRYQDVYHKALCYCLGISDDTRRNVDSIYDFNISLLLQIRHTVPCYKSHTPDSGSVSPAKRKVHRHSRTSPPLYIACTRLPVPLFLCNHLYSVCHCNTG